MIIVHKLEKIINIFSYPEKKRTIKLIKKFSMLITLYYLTNRYIK